MQANKLKHRTSYALFTWPDGWTVHDKESAFRKLREIMNTRKKESANPVKKSPIQNTERCPEGLKLRGDVNGGRNG
jgi:hypothetical protein